MSDYDQRIHRRDRVRVGTSAQRRDDHQPRKISSYDGSFRTGDLSRPGLGPIRDAGLSLHGRRQSRAQAKRRQQIFNYIIIVGIVLCLLTAGIAWMNVSNAKAKKTPLFGTSASAAKANAGKTTVSPAAQAGVTGPTPIVATYKDMQIYLPVNVADLTEVAFHQANFTYTVPLSTHMPLVTLDKAKKQKGTKRDKTVQQTGPDALLVGSCLRMWRSGRHTACTTAIDVGAPAGSTTYAPINGTVTAVKTYSFEGKVNDYEIHVKSDDYPNLEMVMIHVKDPTVKVGDVVVAGTTPLAQVRNMAQYVRNQLATYAPEHGNHTHIQFNDITRSAYKTRQKQLKKQEGPAPSTN